MHRFLHSLRQITRPLNASILITLSPHLVQAAPSDWGSTHQAWIQSLAWSTDACVELRGFSDDPSLSTLFPHSHGLLTLHSYPTTHHLLPPTLKHSSLLGVSQSASSGAGGGGGGGGAGENNLGFKLKRKRFVIETVHLGVEGGVGERRTEPAVDSAGMMARVGGGTGTGTMGVPTEGVEVVDTVGAVAAASGITEIGRVQRELGSGRPKGPDEGKIRVRPKVRFGGEETVEPAVEVERDDGDQQHERHHGHGHNHDHDQTHVNGPPGSGAKPKMAIRHDRMDLYDF